MIPGLVSVTFRQKTPEKICALCVKNGLRAVEWGGDIHVPKGDRSAARQVRQLSADHGLAICSYGSYFRVGDGLAEFAEWLDTASELSTPLVRVWCGRKGSVEANEDERKRVTDELLACAALAGERGISVAPEFHGGTLTDDPESVNRLLRETAGEENLHFYWQPRWDWPEDLRLRTLEAVKPRLSHLHAFTWRHVPTFERLSLRDGEDFWKKALAAAGETCALLEFVRDDSEEALAADAAALREWLRGTD